MNRGRSLDNPGKSSDWLVPGASLRPQPRILAKSSGRLLRPAAYGRGAKDLHDQFRKGIVIVVGGKESLAIDPAVEAMEGQATRLMACSEGMKQVFAVWPESPVAAPVSVFFVFFR
jgi:hypothetical protein